MAESMRRALRRCDFDRVLYLLNGAGRELAEVRQETAWQDTVLTCAAAHGAVAVLVKALDCGASPDIADSRGFTPLHVAAEHGESAAAQLLLERGATVDAKTNLGATPLAVAASHGSAQVVAVLLARNANTLVCDSHGTTPLHAAAGRGHYQAVQEIIRVDACKSIDVKDEAGATALHRAARYGHVRIVHLLHGLSANPESVDFQGCSPLMSAARFGHLQVVEFLHQARADLKRRCSNGKTALDYAREAQHEKVISFFKDAQEYGGLDAEQLRERRTLRQEAENVARAIESMDWKGIVEKFENFGPSVLSSPIVAKSVFTYTSPQGTILHQAVNNGERAFRASALSAILEWAGGSSLVNVTREKDRSTPLHIAVRMDEGKLVELLLKHRSSVAISDRNGDTPLCVAAMISKSMRTLKILLLLGSNVEHKNNDGLRPVDIAERSGNREAGNLLRMWAERAPNRDLMRKAVGFVHNPRSTLLAVLRGDLILSKDVLSEALCGGFSDGNENFLCERLWIAHSLIMLGSRAGILEDYWEKGMNGKRHFLMESVYTHGYKVLRNNPDGTGAAYVRKMLAQAEDLNLIRSAESIFTTAVLARDVRRDVMQIGAAMQSIFQEVCFLQNATWRRFSSIETLAATFGEALRDLSLHIERGATELRGIQNRIQAVEATVEGLEDSQAMTIEALKTLRENIQTQDRARRVAACGKLMLSIIPIAGHFLGHALDMGAELFYAVGATDLTSFAAKALQTGAELAVDEFTAVDVANFELLDKFLSPAFVDSLDESSRKEYRSFIDNALALDEVSHGDLDAIRAQITDLRFPNKPSSQPSVEFFSDISGSSQISNDPTPLRQTGTGSMQPSMTSLREAGVSASSIRAMNRRDLSFAIAAYMLGYDDGLPEGELECLQKCLFDTFHTHDIVGAVLVGEGAIPSEEFIELVLDGLETSSECSVSVGKKVQLRRFVHSLAE